MLGAEQALISSRSAQPTVRCHVASYNTRELTELCLRSMRQYAGIPFRVTVGDSASSDGSVEMLEEFERREWIDIQRARRSHSEWLDFWLATCTEDLAVFIDSDVEFLRFGWLADLVAANQEHRAALVCGEMLPEQSDFIEPVSARSVRLAARPAPWLLLAEIAQLRPDELQLRVSERTERTRA